MHKQDTEPTEANGSVHAVQFAKAIAKQAEQNLAVVSQLLVLAQHIPSAQRLPCLCHLLVVEAMIEMCLRSPQKHRTRQHPLMIHLPLAPRHHIRALQHHTEVSTTAENFPLAKQDNWDELLEWFKPLLEAEKKLDEST